jgi:hypothetical protein
MYVPIRGSGNLFFGAGGRGDLEKTRKVSKFFKRVPFLLRGKFIQDFL